eukprot:TRINITY_DN3134_c0_g1_i2.p1 TRINITY_DN3134_c0_g1~~TRINITY_DN3134_c0_g1_i2.p1  ORF type:complete len:611 (+),score=142.17 TRINITY_DN3134_c0_g1_i2:116-1834(+)
MGRQVPLMACAFGVGVAVGACGVFFMDATRRCGGSPASRRCPACTPPPGVAAGSSAPLDPGRPAACPPPQPPPPQRADAVASAAGLPQTASAGPPSVGPTGGPRPMVSMLSLTRGQHHCNRNILLNAQYQNYPADRLELLVYETSFAPSPDLTAWSRASLRVPLRYRWFNASKPLRSRENPIMGALRNQMLAASTGELLFMMDNDDFYHPNYIHFVVSHFETNQTAQIISLSPHARAMINPDGSVNMAPDMHMKDGAHCQSVRRSAAQRCQFSELEYSEERRLHECVGRGKKLVLSAWNESAGNAMMLVKFQSGISITQQKYAAARVLYNRMTTHDWAIQLAGQAWLYEQWHELSRPSYMPPLSLGTGDAGAPYGPRHMRPYKVLGRSPAAVWSDWQLKHPNFFAPDNWPYCEGYARLSGMTTYDPSNKVATRVASAKECCYICRNASAPPQHTCTAWTYAVQTRECSYFVRPGNGVLQSPENKQNPMYYTQRRPETIMTHDAAVLTDACPKCSEGLGDVGLRSGLKLGGDTRWQMPRFGLPAAHRERHSHAKPSSRSRPRAGARSERLPRA